MKSTQSCPDRKVISGIALNGAGIPEMVLGLFEKSIGHQNVL
jgi:hypothetical protein